jgi:hypothetical protein
MGCSWVAALGGASIIDQMVIDMNEFQVRTLEQVRQVVAGRLTLLLRAVCATSRERAMLHTHR